jgi:Arc/MetJ family transcription regulator
VYNNAGEYTWEAEMRTNVVVVDDDLMESALKLSGLKKKKDAIEEGLKLLVQVKSQEAIRAFRGKLKWSGSLDEMRLNKWLSLIHRFGSTTSTEKKRRRRTG